MTNTAERTEREKAALSVLNGNGGTQSGLEVAEQVYCAKHGVVNGWHGECELCLDEGYRDWDATRVAKSLIPDWTGINPDGRQVIVARVRDALDAVQKIGQYKNSDALVLIIWDSLVTPLDNGKIGLSWTLGEVAETLDVECARCTQPFTPVADERVCESCALTGGAH